jgi:hypothetical protein
MVEKAKDAHGNTTVPLEALRFAVHSAYHRAHLMQEGRAHLLEKWGLSKDNGKLTESPMEGLIARSDQNTLLRILIDLPLADDVAGKFGTDKTLNQVAKAYGLDVKAAVAPIERERAAEWKVRVEKREARLAKEREKLQRLKAKAKSTKKEK